MYRIVFSQSSWSVILAKLVFIFVTDTSVLNELRRGRDSLLLSRPDCGAEPMEIFLRKHHLGRDHSFWLLDSSCELEELFAKRVISLYTPQLYSQADSLLRRLSPFPVRTSSSLASPLANAVVFQSSESNY